MYTINGKGSLVRLIAGVLVVASLFLGYWVNDFFYLVTAFVGTMQIISSLTGFCFIELLLKLFKVQERKATKE